MPDEAKGDIPQLPEEHDEVIIPTRLTKPAFGRGAAPVLDPSGAQVLEILGADNEASHREDPASVVKEIGTTNEALADFLGGFVQVADANEVTYGENENGYTYLDNREVVRYIENAGPHNESFALLRSGVASDRRPAAQHEEYVVINMRTGAAVTFSDADIQAIRQGNYTRARVTRDAGIGSDYIDPRDIATVAGITRPYDEDDPVVQLTAPRKESEIVQTRARLTTVDQVTRLGNLLQLERPEFEDVKVDLAPQTPQDLIHILTQNSTLELLKRLKNLSVPSGRAPFIVDAEDDVRLTVFTQIVNELDAEKKQAIYDAISYISFHDLDHFDEEATMASLLEDSVTDNGDGTFTAEPSLALFDRIEVDDNDKLRGIYDAVGGGVNDSFIRSEDGSYKLTKDRRINENLVRFYAQQFSELLIGRVEAVRDYFDIPNDIPQEEQVLMLIRNYRYIHKGMELLRNPDIHQNRREVTGLEWAKLCRIIDLSREGAVPAGNEAFLEKFGLGSDAILQHLSGEGSGSTAQAIVTDVVRDQAEEQS